MSSSPSAASADVIVDVLVRMVDAPREERERLAREGLMAVQVLAEDVQDVTERSAALMREAAETIRDLSS